MGNEKPKRTWKQRENSFVSIYVICYMFLHFIFASFAMSTVFFFFEGWQPTSKLSGTCVWLVVRPVTYDCTDRPVFSKDGFVSDLTVVEVFRNGNLSLPRLWLLGILGPATGLCHPQYGIRDMYKALSALPTLLSSKRCCWMRLRISYRYFPIIQFWYWSTTDFTPTKFVGKNPRINI